jgi:DNA-binding CsgD family transcriptional regulator
MEKDARSAAAAGPRTGGNGQGGHRLSSAFEALERLPVLADVADRVAERAGRAGAAEGELIEMIESDGALAAAIMRAALLKRLPGEAPLSGIPQAVGALKAEGVAEVARGVQRWHLSGDHTAGVWGDMPRVHRAHGVATRRAAEAIGDLARLPARDELILAALVHDIGRIVMHVLHPGYAEILGNPDRTPPEETVRRERRELGIDHALVGGVLTRRWGFAGTVASAIERHHSDDAEGPAAAIRLADLIARHVRGDVIQPVLLQPLGERLGLNASEVRDLLLDYPYGGTKQRRVSEPCPLSPREVDALRGLASGMVYKDIAREMTLSASTVRTHLHNVYRKIGAADRAQAVLIARDRGWL